MMSSSRSDLRALEQTVRLIAMYLPQFHPIPENDRWWGKGFTEWTNVRKAQPLFPGHHQPHVPEGLGHYDLRDHEIRVAQADMAASYGVHGFCYYHYWFNGKRLLETPFNEVLRSGEPTLPFCLCWANENWTRRWDGLDSKVLMAQNYSDADSVEFIRDLFPALRDQRYIRVNGKPLLLIYRTSLLPDPKRTTDIWREEMLKAGMGELYLVRVENFLGTTEPHPSTLGFDAAMEFAPYWTATGAKLRDLADAGLPQHKLPEDVSVYDYDHCMRTMMSRPQPDYKLFRGVFPSWDNTSRRNTDATLFVNSSPAKYAFWLSSMLRHTIDTFIGDERLMFVNAWNEWGEGCHLEPDLRNGANYLEATRLALQQAADYAAIGPCGRFEIDEWYTELQTAYAQKQEFSQETLLVVRVLQKLLHSSVCEEDVQKALIKEQREKIQMRDEVSACLYTIEKLKSSLSWRVTAPLRFLLDGIKR